MRARVSAVVLLSVAVVLGGWAYWRQVTIKRGQEAFRRLGCGDCHYAGGAPNLSNVTERYDRETLAHFIHDPEAVYRQRGKRPLNANYFPMPNPHASEDDAKAIVAYLGSLAR